MKCGIYIIVKVLFWYIGERKKENNNDDEEKQSETKEHNEQNELGIGHGNGK